MSSDTWMLTSGALVMLMTPALGLFYGGLVSDRAVINTIMLSFGTLAAVSTLWALCGYSLAFAPSIDSIGFIGDFSLAPLGFSDRYRISNSVSEHAFAFYQMMFAIITPAVISGAVVERMRFGYFILFASIWHLIVYCPLAHWVWEPSGWLNKLGLLDTAGGTVVETSSGVSALTLAFLMTRFSIHKKKQAPPRPHNLVTVLLGASLLWFGWFGFNAGGFNPQNSIPSLTARTVLNTHLAASSAMLTYNLMEFIVPPVGSKQDFFTGKPSSVGAACGAVVGLVAITPACGYVTIDWGIFIGVIASISVYYAARNVNRLLQADDRLDVFAFHGVAGIVGTAATGLFATTDADSPQNGAFYGAAKQFGIQLIGLGATFAICILGTSIAFFILLLLSKQVKISLEYDPDYDIDAETHGEDAYYTSSSTTDDKINEAQELLLNH